MGNGGAAVPSRGVAARRFPLIPVVLCTLLAFASAVGVYVAFGDDGEPSAPSEQGEEALELQPTGELPASVDDVRLAGLGANPTQKLGEFTGEKPVVLNFFASWCIPCLDEMPAFESVYQELGDSVNFVGLANLDSPDEALEIVAETGVTYPTFNDIDASAITFFGGTQMPTTVFIDTAGEVVSVDSQPFDAEELRARIDELLGVQA
jgi:thiol-disulfide isomerase/thioredoxin